jgi:transaldolase
MGSLEQNSSRRAETRLTNRPKTKILVDGGDPDETETVKRLLGFVDGQTTNPSLIGKKPRRRSSDELRTHAHRAAAGR